MQSALGFCADWGLFGAVSCGDFLGRRFGFRLNLFSLLWHVGLLRVGHLGFDRLSFGTLGFFRVLDRKSVV